LTASGSRNLREKIANLIARPKLELWRRLELHAYSLLDLRDVERDLVGIGTASNVRALSTAGREHERQ
jgi:hypothetical protein